MRLGGLSRALAVVVAFSIAPGCSCGAKKRKHVTSVTLPDGRRLEYLCTVADRGFGHFGNKQCGLGAFVSLTGFDKLFSLRLSQLSSCDEMESKCAKEEGTILTRAEEGVVAVAIHGKHALGSSATLYIPNGLAPVMFYANDPDPATALERVPPFDQGIDDLLRGPDPPFFHPYSEPEPRDALADVLAVRERLARHVDSFARVVAQCEAPRSLSALLLEIDEKTATKALFDGSFACEDHGSHAAAWEKAIGVRSLLLERKPSALAAVVTDDLAAKKHPAEAEWLATLAAAAGARDAVPSLQKMLVWPDPPRTPEDPRMVPWLSLVHAIAKLDPERGGSLLATALGQLPEGSNCVFPRPEAGDSERDAGAPPETRLLASYIGDALRPLRSAATEKRLVAMASDPNVALSSRQVARALLELWSVPPPKNAAELSDCQTLTLEAERKAMPK